MTSYKIHILAAKNLSAEHRVDITESASAQFPTCIVTFGQYGQLRVSDVSVRAKDP